MLLTTKGLSPTHKSVLLQGKKENQAGSQKVGCRENSLPLSSVGRPHPFVRASSFSFSSFQCLLSISQASRYSEKVSPPLLPFSKAADSPPPPPFLPRAIPPPPPRLLNQLLLPSFSIIRFAPFFLRPGDFPDIALPRNAGKDSGPHFSDPSGRTNGCRWCGGGCVVAIRLTAFVLRQDSKDWYMQGTLHLILLPHLFCLIPHFDPCTRSWCRLCRLQ